MRSVWSIHAPRRPKKGRSEKWPPNHEERPHSRAKTLRSRFHLPRAWVAVVNGTKAGSAHKGMRAPCADVWVSFLNHVHSPAISYPSLVKLTPHRTPPPLCESGSIFFSLPLKLMLPPGGEARVSFWKPVC